MENNPTNHLNRGRCVHKPNRRAFVIEDETEFYPGNLMDEYTHGETKIDDSEKAVEDTVKK